MLQINIESFTNGYSLIVYDPKDGYIAREVHKEKVQALGALQDVIAHMIGKEYNDLQHLASFQ